MSIGPNHRDNHGNNPCIPPHILGRLLDKLQPLRAKISAERGIAQDGWAGIDKLAENMEAACP